MRKLTLKEVNHKNIDVENESKIELKVKYSLIYF